MRFDRMFKAGVGIFLLSTAWAGSAAHSATMCSAGSPDVSGLGTGFSACNLASTINNDNDLSAVNAENFFGFGDWLYSAKDDDLDGVNDGSNAFNLVFSNSTTVDDGGTAYDDTDVRKLGDWSFNYSSVFDYMLIFKGANKADPEAVVAYLVDSASLGSGTYFSPFYNSPTDTPGVSNPKQISHASLFYRNAGSSTIPEVPLPAGIVLLLSGLGALGVLRRRRRFGRSATA